MRIIDSNKDFYDYFQNVYLDNSLTFDRRDSYNLSKKEFAGRFLLSHRNSNTKRKILLQVCNTFWLFELIILKTAEGGICTDYSLSLIDTWKNYSCKSELIKLSEISYRVGFYYWNKKDSEKLEKKWIEAVKNGDFETKQIFNRFTVSRSKGSGWEEKEKHIPILKNIGIASEVNPLDVYLALEEYFSKEKTKNERTESIGLTDKDKISNHGFDLKKSFREK